VEAACPISCGERRDPFEERVLAVFEHARDFAGQHGMHNGSSAGRRAFRASALGFTVYCWDKGLELCVDIWPHWEDVRVQHSVHGRSKLFSARRRHGRIFVAFFLRGIWEDRFLDVAQAVER
jgi:hypothetical protein